MVQPTQNFYYKPIKMYKPPKLTLRDQKSEWETLINWRKKFKDYCRTGFADLDALEDTTAIRSIMKGCMEDNIIARCKSKLQSAKNVKELSKVLKDQEEIRWPTQKRLKTLMRIKRKGSEDPMTYLAELRREAKFCQIR